MSNPQAFRRKAGSFTTARTASANRKISIMNLNRYFGAVRSMLDQDRADRFLEVGQRPADFRRAAEVDAAKPVVDLVAEQILRRHRVGTIEFRADGEVLTAHQTTGRCRVPAIEFVLRRHRGMRAAGSVFVLDLDDTQAERIISVIGVVLKRGWKRPK